MLNFSKKNKKIFSAFSLIEMLVAIGIFTLLILGITYMVFISYRYYTFVMNQTEITSTLQKSLNLISKEIREMRQADSGSYGLFEATDDEIIFYSNLDNISDVERIKYTKTNNCIVKGVIKPSGTPSQYLSQNEQFSNVTCNLANKVDEPVFEFYSGYPSTSTHLTAPIELTKVKVIKITLRISSSSTKNAPSSKVISIYVTPRNMNFSTE